jgi:hypothetical protein
MIRKNFIERRGCSESKVSLTSNPNGKESKMLPIRITRVVRLQPMVEVSLMIYANQYYGLDHPWSNIEKSIERYSTRRECIWLGLSFTRKSSSKTRKREKAKLQLDSPAERGEREGFS